MIMFLAKVGAVYLFCTGCVIVGTVGALVMDYVTRRKKPTGERFQEGYAAGFDAAEQSEKKLREVQTRVRHEERWI